MRGNVAIMLRMLGALQTIARLTASLSLRRVLREQVQWIAIAELADRTIESPHDRGRFENRLAQVRDAFETESVLLAGVPLGRSARVHGNSFHNGPLLDSNPA